MDFKDTTPIDALSPNERWAALIAAVELAEDLCAALMGSKHGETPALPSVGSWRPGEAEKPSLLAVSGALHNARELCGRYVD